jgi:exodeoxyribonuclease III
VAGVKLVTWNVNSLAARMPRVLAFLGAFEPDVALLQETKCADDAFPDDELLAAGYHAAHHSAGRWAGVAILARSEPSNVSAGLPGELRADEARWIEADVGDVRVASVYVTNGRAVGSEWFGEKLAFLDAMALRAEQLRDGPPLIVGGDFNVTRSDRDVYDPAAFAGETHVTPDERSRLEAILDRGGLVDAFRRLHPDEVQYTWWDYRQGHFHKNLGLRIDYALVAQSLAPQLREAGMVRDFRKGKPTPSDHAPLLIELDRG